MTELQVIQQQAQADLRTLKVRTISGEFFPAGAHQFGSFWTRDFCLAVPGLLRAGYDDVVERQLKTLIAMRSAEGFLPRGFDTIDPKRRVVRHTVFRFLPGQWPGYVGGLKPEHLGEHGTPAFDSNALAILATLQWADKNPGKSLDDFHLKELLNPYFRHLQDGFVVQPDFSDWQDSARRNGVGLFVNLVILKAAISLEKHGISVPDKFQPKTFRQKIHSHFFDSEIGLYRQSANDEQIPLESNLWIAAEEIMAEQIPTAKLLENLRRHQIWTNFAVPVFPFNHGRDVSYTTKMVGLRHYHDGLTWSWLLADQAALAQKCGDQQMFEKIVKAQVRAVRKYGCIHEVYKWNGRELKPFWRPLYKSEGPFLWAAGRWLTV